MSSFVRRSAIYYEFFKFRVAVQTTDIQTNYGFQNQIKGFRLCSNFIVCAATPDLLEIFLFEGAAEPFEIRARTSVNVAKTKALCLILKFVRGVLSFPQHH